MRENVSDRMSLLELALLISPESKEVKDCV